MSAAKSVDIIPEIIPEGTPPIQMIPRGTEQIVSAYAFLCALPQPLPPEAAPFIEFLEAQFEAAPRREFVPMPRPAPAP